MGKQTSKLCIARVMLAVTVLAASLPGRVAAQSHPQEVLDLVAAHEALAMKIRPLQDRIVVSAAPQAGTAGFNPEGAPIRAKGSTTTDDAATGAENRSAETLRHRDRAAAPEPGGLGARLSAFAEKARVESERISQPGFGLRSAAREAGSGAVRFGDGRPGARLPATASSQDSTDAASKLDSAAIAQARTRLTALEREFAALEKEADTMRRR